VKEDKDFLQSCGHPDLTNSGPLRTMSASQARVKRVRASTGHLLTDFSSGEDEGLARTGNEDDCSVPNKVTPKSTAK